MQENISKMKENMSAVTKKLEDDTNKYQKKVDRSKEQMEQLAADIKMETGFNLDMPMEEVEKVKLFEVKLKCDPKKILTKPKYKTSCSNSWSWWSGSGGCRTYPIVKGVTQDCFTKKAEFFEEKTRMNLQLQNDYNQRVAEAKNMA